MLRTVSPWSEYTNPSSGDPGRAYLLPNAATLLQRCRMLAGGLTDAIGDGKTGLPIRDGVDQDLAHTDTRLER